MSIAILSSRAQFGVDAPPVTIEVFLSGGLPRFNVVGMPEAAVRESGDRVRGAIINSGYAFPRERVTVSLAPADMRKTGGRFDLPIALGILAAQKIIPADSVGGTEFYGELSAIQLSVGRSGQSGLPDNLRWYHETRKLLLAGGQELV